MTEPSLPQENQPETKRSSGAKTAIFIATIAIIIFISCFGYGYYELSKVNIQLAQMVTDLQKNTVNNQNDISGLQKSLGEVKQSSQKSQDVSNQQQQMMSEWKDAQQGDLNKWHIAQAQYLTKMADAQLQFAHDPKAAILLLQQADKELQSSQDPKLIEIRKALTSDLTNLQALPQVDVTSVFLQLNALNNLIDKLPLPINPLTQDNQSNTKSQINQTSWWKSGLDSAWEGLNKIVIVKKTSTTTLPLVMPDEKMFLLQNIHAQIDNARWGLLHNNPEVYTSSLARVTEWIQQYFVQDAQETKTALQNLSELQKVNIQPAVTTLSNTLQLFDNYFAQVKTETQPQNISTPPAG